MKYFIATLVFLSAYQIANARILSSLTRGSCLVPPTVADFDASKVVLANLHLAEIFFLLYLQYLGFWYQYSGIPSFFSPSQTKCIRATYGAKGK